MQIRVSLSHQTTRDALTGSLTDDENFVTGGILETKPRISPDNRGEYTTIKYVVSYRSVSPITSSWRTKKAKSETEALCYVNSLLESKAISEEVYNAIYSAILDLEVAGNSSGDITLFDGVNFHRASGGGLEKDLATHTKEPTDRAVVDCVSSLERAMGDLSGFLEELPYSRLLNAELILERIKALQEEVRRC